MLYVDVPERVLTGAMRCDALKMQIKFQIFEQ